MMLLRVISATTASTSSVAKALPIQQVPSSRRIPHSPVKSRCRTVCMGLLPVAQLLSKRADWKSTVRVLSVWEA